jgi:hypothetical protein
METASLTQTRSLTELVQVEYMALFGQAFGYFPKEGTLETRVNPEQQVFVLTNGRVNLIIYNDGTMVSEGIDPATDTVYPARFNAVNLVNQLTAFGVNLSARMLPKSPEDRLHEQERVIGAGCCPTSEVRGTLFHFRLLTSNLPPVDIEGLNQILITAWRWASGDTLHSLTGLAAFYQKLYQELYYMELDLIDVKTIQVQWLEENRQIAIASNTIPVTIYATISRVEKEGQS